MVDSLINTKSTTKNYDSNNGNNKFKEQQIYNKSKFNPSYEPKKPQNQVFTVQNFNIAIQKNEFILPGDNGQPNNNQPKKQDNKKDLSSIINYSGSQDEINNMSVSRIVYNPHISFSSVNKTVNKLVDQIGETDRKPTQRYYFNQNGIFKSTINISSGESQINNSSDYNNSNLFQISNDQFTLINNDDYIFNSNNNADKLYSNYSNFSNYKEDLIQGDKLVKQMIETNMRKALRTYSNSKQEFMKPSIQHSNMTGTNNQSTKPSKLRINDNKNLPPIIEETTSFNKKMATIGFTQKNNNKIINNAPSISSKISNVKIIDNSNNMIKNADGDVVKKTTINNESIKLSLKQSNNFLDKESMSIKESKNSNILSKIPIDDLKQKDLMTLKNITYSKNVEINNSKMTSCTCLIF